MTTAYHSASKQPTAGMNRVPEEMLRLYVNSTQNIWDKLLSLLESAMHNNYQFQY